MNKIYRVIWNASLGAWVAVSEITKGQTKSKTKTVGTIIAAVGAVTFSPNFLAAANNTEVGGGITISPCAENSIDGLSFAIGGCNAKTSTITSGATTLKEIQLAATASETHYFSIEDDGNKGSNYDNDGATGANSIALGKNTSATGSASQAIGNNASATANSTLALGNMAKASASNAQALGNYANASGEGSAAVGFGAHASGESAVAVGRDAVAAALNSVAVGNNTRANKQFSLAVGAGAQATEDRAIAIGGLASAKNSLSIGVGSSVKSTADFSIAIGDSVIVSNKNSVAVGTNSVISVDDALALGTAANVSAKGGIALGSGSRADRVATGTSEVYRPSNLNQADIDAINATKSTRSGALSIGSAENTRQIINVAAGTQDADAVNVAQLKAVARTAEKNLDFSVKYDKNSDGSINKNKVVFSGITATSNKAADGKITTIGGTSLNNVASAGDYTDVANASKGVNAGDLNNAVTNVGKDLTAKGLDFAGNSGEFHRNLGDKVTIKGEGTKADDQYTGQSVKTIADAQGNITVMLDKDFKSETITSNTVTTNTITLTGKDGLNGKDGISITAKDGKSGLNGLDGTTTTRIIYEKPDGSSEEVATLNDGLKFKGNQGNTIAKKLNETLEIVGGLADGKSSSAENIRTVTNKDGQIEVQLAKNLTNLESVTVGDTSINNAGLTIKNGPSIKVGGINAGAKVISNLSKGIDGKDAVNVDQLKDAGSDLTAKGLDFAGDSGKFHRNLGDKVTIKGEGNKADDQYTGQSVKTIADDQGNITVKLDKNFKSETITTNKVILVGKDGLNGTDGISVTAKEGKPGLNGLDGSTTTRIIYHKPDGSSEEVATLNDGLKFAANMGDVLIKELNGLLNVDGGMSSTEENAASAENIRTVSKDGKLEIQLSKDLKNLNSITTNHLTVTGDTKLGDHFTVNKAGAYYDGPINENKHIVNKEYVDGVVDGVVLKPLSFAGNTGSVTKKPGEMFTIKGTGVKADNQYSAENVKTHIDADGDLIIALDKNLKVDSLVLNGRDGKDGISITSAQGKAGVNGIDGTTTSRIIYDGPDGREEVATLNDGMRFAGNTGDILIKRLNELMYMVGGMTSVAEDAASAENIRTVTKDGQLEIQLSKNLVDLESVTVGDIVISNEGLTIKNGPSITASGIDAGGKVMTNVAAGTDATDAVNVSQLRQVSNASKTEIDEGNNIKVIEKKGKDGQIVYTVATEDEVKFEKVTVGDVVIDAAIGDITGLKNTSLGTDDFAQKGRAATEEQLNFTQNNLVNILGGNAVNTGGNVLFTNIGNTGKDNIHDAIGSINDKVNNADHSWNVTTNGKRAHTNVKAGDTVDFSNTDGNINIDNDGHNIKINLVKDLDLGTDGSIKAGDTTVNKDGIKTGDTTINGNGLTIAGGPSVTKDGIDAGDKKVTGVADGTIAKGSKDAVNGGQLFDAIGEAAAAAKTEVIAGKNMTVTNKSPGANGQDIYEVATADDVTFKNVNTDSIKVAGGVEINDKGINAGNKVITGVADGAIKDGSKEAVNGSQLNNTNQKVTEYFGGGSKFENGDWTAPSYTVGHGDTASKHNNVGGAIDALNKADQALGDRITNLGDRVDQGFYQTNKRIGDIEKTANAGIAAAMALEGAPFVAGKYTYAAGTAYHGGENAIGVTLRKTSDNGRWSVTGGVAAASQGDPSVRLGISGVMF